MVAKTLTLDCPRGETGRDSLNNEGPTRLPEAFRALQSGKLPRKAGLIVVRHGIQYDLTLQAETLAVSGAGLPKVEGASGREAHEARVDTLRHLVETLDLLYDAYGRRRTGPDWAGDLGRIRDWLAAASMRVKQSVSCRSVRHCDVGTDDRAGHVTQCRPRS